MTINPGQEQELQQGARQLGINLTAEQTRLLMDYLSLLIKWNKAYNLTAVRDPAQMVSRHLLDSLSVVPFVAQGGDSWLDVGSGGGMPGIILAIMFADKNFCLLDANGKKTRFLTQVKLELQLENVTVVQSRIEQHQVEQPYAGIISRAFSSLADFTGLTSHLGDSHSRWLAMKGVQPDDELQALPESFRLDSCHRLQVPGCQGQRHLLILSRQ